MVSLESSKPRSHECGLATNQVRSERPLMKTFYNVSIKLIMVAIACSFVASAAIQARSADDARLIVNRSADFGVEESINLAIDGVQVAVLGMNQNYDAALSPGKHVVSITTKPEPLRKQSACQIPV